MDINNSKTHSTVAVAAPSTTTAAADTVTLSGLTPYQSLPHNRDVALQGIVDASSRRWVQHYIQAALQQTQAQPLPLLWSHAMIPTVPVTLPSLSATTHSAEAAASAIAAAAHLVPFASYCPNSVPSPIMPLGLLPMLRMQSPFGDTSGSTDITVPGYLQPQLMQRLVQGQSHPNAFRPALGACFNNTGSKDASKSMTATVVPAVPTATSLHRHLPAGSTDSTDISAMSSIQSDLVCRPILLAQPTDVDKLSSLQVLLRHQIEVFVATESHVSSHLRGRTKRLRLGQVGIRCRHCAHLPLAMHSKGSTYFPTTVQGFYQASQNMSHIHLQSGSCTSMPKAIQEQFAALVGDKKGATTVISSAGRKYWTSSARRDFGLVDTDQGIYFSNRLPTDANIVEDSLVYRHAAEVSTATAAGATKATTGTATKRSASTDNKQDDNIASTSAKRSKKYIQSGYGK